MEFIQPGKPTQNAFMSVLTGHTVQKYSILSVQNANEVREITEKWLSEYNYERPQNHWTIWHRRNTDFTIIWPDFKKCMELKRVYLQFRHERSESQLQWTLTCDNALYSITVTGLAPGLDWFFNTRDNVSSLHLWSFNTWLFQQTTKLTLMLYEHICTISWVYCRNDLPTVLTTPAWERSTHN